ncbi:MAG: hypothetical protein WA948_06650 [Pontixanthobacter sp.]
MGDLTTDSDRLLMEGRRLRDDNRSGGRHRAAIGATGKSIGAGSAAIKSKRLVRKLIQIAIGVVAIFIAAGIAGAILNGIGFWGVILTVLSLAALVLVVATSKTAPPKRAELTKGDVRQMVGKTELWLEHQRAALPAPAASIVGDMGVQLDALGLQLETVDQSHPAAREVRKLVGEVLPETVESYRKIPAHLRAETRTGATPDQQLTDSLTKISREIDSVTRQLAEGSLDDLAIKTRYLEYRYGEGDDTKPVEPN